MSPSPQSADNLPAPSGTSLALVGVRYSLAQMLAELRIDRASGTLAKEKLDAVEIGKLFKPQTRRRAKSSR